ncbi:MAG: hypothetical protein U0836_15425 [Pirellulales bacterium]
MDRRATMLWMGELLDHVRACHESLEEADPRRAARLAEAIERDLADLRSLCQSLGAGCDTAPAACERAA